MPEFLTGILANSTGREACTAPAVPLMIAEVYLERLRELQTTIEGSKVSMLQGSSW